MLACVLLLAGNYYYHFLLSLSLLERGLAFTYNNCRNLLFITIHIFSIRNKNA